MEERVLYGYIDELSKILYKIIEAGEEKNVTEENRKIAFLCRHGRKKRTTYEK